MTPFGSRVSNVVQMDAEGVRYGEKRNKVDDETLEKSISAFSSEFEGEASTSKARTEGLPVIQSADGIDYDDDDYEVDNDNDNYNFLGCFDNEEKDNNVPQLESDDDYIPDDEELKLSWKEELIMSDDGTTQPEEHVKLSVKAKKKKKHKSKPVKKTAKLHRTTRDDGDDRLFQKRIRYCTSILLRLLLILPLLLLLILPLLLLLILRLLLLLILPLLSCFLSF